MATKLKINPTTGRLDLIENIPQLNFDPASPRPEEAWVLKRTVAGIGSTSLWLFLPMFNTSGEMEDTTTYDLSFRSKDSTTLRVRMEVGTPYLDPSTSEAILTEDGDNLVTEDGDQIVTE